VCYPTHTIYASYTKLEFCISRERSQYFCGFVEMLIFFLLLKSPNFFYVEKYTHNRVIILVYILWQANIKKYYFLTGSEKNDNF